MRVLANSVTTAIGDQLMGHDPNRMPREVIAHEEDRPLYRFSTDSPLRSTTGDLEAMALYSGQGVSLIDDLPTAAERVTRIMAEAEASLTRLQTMTGAR